MLVFMTTRTLSGLFLPMLFKMRFSLRPDGKILIHDGRARIRAQDTLQIDAEVTSVQFHPMMEHIFLSSDSRGRVCLRDTRMAFGPSSSRTKEGVVHSYHTYICRRSSSSLARLETSSVVFNSDGSQLCATNLVNQQSRRHCNPADLEPASPPYNLQLERSISCRCLQRTKSPRWYSRACKRTHIPEHVHHEARVLWRAGAQHGFIICCRL
ncbi:unnamed protein product [Mycena citricolor]|uniref:Uncharacterized protein n=1 Tax=Mycena citricolor TaxID=2018698 RepID=A0AAD2H5X7_9AGAR|nr:unnamed protein product [Mycena citricolor]